MSKPGRSLAGAALAVAAVTVLARAVGFGRWIVFARTVRGGCLADVYNTANLLPNVLFEVAAGGALAGVVVPVLAGAVARGDRAHTDRTVSALLTWALTLLVPVSLAGAVFARRLMRFFLGTGQCADAALAVGTRMLLIFLPQLFCYAIAVVLSGALQAHRRFLAAALAPLVSSVVVIGAYLSFARLAHGRVDPTEVPGPAQAALAIGTTAGVFALAVTVLLPVRSAGVRLRPCWSFPAGVAPAVRGLAVAGLAALLAQQGTLLVVTWLANNRGTPGALTAYTWAGAVFLLPYAVLAVPPATSAFPRIAAATSAGDGALAAGLTASTARAVLASSCLGAALLTAVAVPVSQVFATGRGGIDASRVAAGIAAMAPGLIGYGLSAHLSRVLYAAHRGRRAATAIVAGWVIAAVADVALVLAAPGIDVVPALAAGTSIGLTAAAGLLLVAVGRLHGPRGLAGLRRTGPAALLAAAVAAGLGRILGDRYQHAGRVGSAAGATVVALVVAGVFVAMIATVDRGCLDGFARITLLRRNGLQDRGRTR